MKIFLDDIRNPSEVNYIDNDIYLTEGWTIVRDYTEFTECIDNANFSDIEMITFDHDLSDFQAFYGAYPELLEEALETGKELGKTKEWEEKLYQEKTGMDCVKYLVEVCMGNDYTLPDYLVHSTNPSGAENIQCFLDNFKKFQNA